MKIGTYEIVSTPSRALIVTTAIAFLLAGWPGAFVWLALVGFCFLCGWGLIRFIENNVVSFDEDDEVAEGVTVQSVNVSRASHRS